MFKHIIMATDGSAASERAAHLAIELARTHSAKLTAVYVLDPYPFLAIGETNPLGFQAYMASAQQHATQAHTKIAALCAQAATPVALEARIVENSAAAAGIVQVATDESADLIVVGSHGRSGMARLMVGSVAGKVVAESPIPVLVAR